MGIIMLILLGFSLLLLIVSIFQKDSYKELKEEVDQLTMQHVQDIYQLKKKLKVLEEELLVGDEDFTNNPFTITRKKEIHEIIKNQVLALAQQGKPIEQIAKQASLSIEDVYTILSEYKNRGNNNE